MFRRGTSVSDFQGGGGGGGGGSKNRTATGSSISPNTSSMAGSDTNGSAHESIAGSSATEANPSSLGNAMPQGLVTIASVTIASVTRAAPNVSSCAALPEKGKSKDGMCQSDMVLVIVNDVTAEEMTCCPVGMNVLTSNPAERHFIRTKCENDEVATGISRPNFYCSKINTTYLKLSVESSSLFVTPQSGLTQEEKNIASSYNRSDTCICPKGSIVVGPHELTDNTCAEKCVQIQKK